MSQRKARVLLVEDDDSIRSALDVSLRAEGYEVQAEPEGYHITNLAERFRPDIAILDVHLPVGPDGYTMAGRCARAATCPCCS